MRVSASNLLLGVLWPLLRLPRHLARGVVFVLDVAWDHLAVIGKFEKDGSRIQLGSEIPREVVLNAGKELGELAWLVIDQTPDMYQLGKFVKEGTEAVRAVSRVPLFGQDKLWAMMNMAEGFLSSVNKQKEWVPVGPKETEDGKNKV